MRDKNGRISTGHSFVDMEFSHFSNTHRRVFASQDGAKSSGGHPSPPRLSVFHRSTGRKWTAPGSTFWSKDSWVQLKLARVSVPSGMRGNWQKIAINDPDLPSWPPSSLLPAHRSRSQVTAFGLRIRSHLPLLVWNFLLGMVCALS